MPRPNETQRSLRAFITERNEADLRRLEEENGIILAKIARLVAHITYLKGKEIG